MILEHVYYRGASDCLIQSLAGLAIILVILTAYHIRDTCYKMEIVDGGSDCRIGC